MPCGCSGTSQIPRVVAIPSNFRSSPRPRMDPALTRGARKVSPRPIVTAPVGTSKE